MSMAFQIFTYCDQRYALPYSLLLWHPPRLSGRVSLTPKKAAQVNRELAALEKDLVPQILKSLNLPRRFVMTHYHDETIWTAVRLNRIVPGFMRITDSIPGAAGVWAPSWADMQDCIDYCKPFDWRVVQ
jgi:hypothetical protein